MSYIMAMTSAMPAATCVPSNDLLTGPLGPIIEQLAGGFGGLLVPIAFMMILLTAVGVVVTILTRKAAVLMKAIGLLIGVVLGVPLLIMLVMAVHALLNSGCSGSPF